MSELLDKQVNAQKEKTSGVHASSRKPMKKCTMKMKETNKEKNNTCVKITKKKQHVRKNNKEKNDMCVKILLMEGGHL